MQSRLVVGRGLSETRLKIPSGGEVQLDVVPDGYFARGLVVAMSEREPRVRTDLWRRPLAAWSVFPLACRRPAPDPLRTGQSTAPTLPRTCDNEPT